MQLNSQQNYFNRRFQEVLYQLKWRFSDTVFTEQDSLKQYIDSVWTDKSLLLSCHRTGSCHHCSLLLQALTFSSLTEVMLIWNTQFLSTYSHSCHTKIIFYVKKNNLIVAKITLNLTLILIIYVIELKYTYSSFTF